MNMPSFQQKPNPRHALTTRIWHWVNALSLLIMLMSGLMIFNAHPRLYWGEAGNANDYAWMAVGSSNVRGYLRFGKTRITTTGFLGKWQDEEGEMQKRAFPGWATIPSYYSLADGRRWHFFFAWIFGVGLALFMVRSFWNKHIQRDLHVRRTDWRPASIWQSFKTHTRLGSIRKSAGKDYNVIQKLSYTGVIFILFPVMILTGLTMSPAMDANWPLLSDMFGGRQSARSIHFISAFLLVLFFIVHMVMVVLSGPIRQIKAMITGGERIND